MKADFNKESTLITSQSKISTFFKRQIRQIKAGGVEVLFKKAWKLIKSILGVVLAFPFVLSVRLLSPLVLIRFGSLRSDRIGHFAPETELYLCAKEAGLDRKVTIDIFCHTPTICNEQLRKMWGRLLYSHQFVYWLDWLNRRLPGRHKHNKHIVPLPSTYYNSDIHGLFDCFPTHLKFTEEEERFGVEKLKDMGIIEKERFVCFYNRDAVYLNTQKPTINWDYHNYRDASIQNYVLAAEELAKKGYYVIRIGDVVKEPMLTISPRIIDYATNGMRSDFMDIYLCMHCKFFISSAGGLSGVPMTFRRPIGFVNFIPLEYVWTWSKNGMFIPKKLWLKEQKRFMTFQEVIESCVGRYLKREDYEKQGIEVIENNPQEIKSFVIEMEMRLNGQWEETDEDCELQKRFWSLFGSSDLHGKIVSRIGADFLRQNRELLD